MTVRNMQWENLGDNTKKTQQKQRKIHTKAKNPSGIKNKIHKRQRERVEVCERDRERERQPLTSKIVNLQQLLLAISM